MICEFLDDSGVETRRAVGIDCALLDSNRLLPTMDEPRHINSVLRENNLLR